MEAGYVAEKCLGYEQITGLSTAKGLTLLPKGSTVALIVPEVQSVRWRDDGTAPTASVGMPLISGNVLKFTAGQFAAVKFIETTAGAIVNVAYYGG